MTQKMDYYLIAYKTLNCFVLRYNEKKKKMKHVELSNTAYTNNI